MRKNGDGSGESASFARRIALTLGLPLILLLGERVPAPGIDSVRLRRRVVVATPNPMDLDYRALSNAGRWCLARLQTDADRANRETGAETSLNG